MGSKSIETDMLKSAVTTTDSATESLLICEGCGGEYKANGLRIHQARCKPYQEQQAKQSVNVTLMSKVRALRKLCHSMPDQYPKLFLAKPPDYNTPMPKPQKQAEKAALSPIRHSLHVQNKMQAVSIAEEDNSKDGRRTNSGTRGKGSRKQYTPAQKVEYIERFEELQLVYGPSKTIKV